MTVGLPWALGYLAYAPVTATMVALTVAWALWQWAALGIEQGEWRSWWMLGIAQGTVAVTLAVAHQPVWCAGIVLVSMPTWWMVIGGRATGWTLAALAQGGEIFVLDMGEPVRIVELAEEMIALSGLRPHEDIPIMYTGIRPGEKLFEELDVTERSAYKTGHARIFVSKIREAASCEVNGIMAACEALGQGCQSVEESRATLRRLITDESAPPAA